jgi:hypothetical protein
LFETGFGWSCGLAVAASKKIENREAINWRMLFLNCGFRTKEFSTVLGAALNIVSDAGHAPPQLSSTRLDDL